MAKNLYLIKLLNGDGSNETRVSAADSMPDALNMPGLADNGIHDISHGMKLLPYDLAIPKIRSDLDHLLNGAGLLLDTAQLVCNELTPHKHNRHIDAENRERLKETVFAAKDRLDKTLNQLLLLAEYTDNNVDL